MTPAAIDRVFGRGRLRMVTGDHCEVFREESQAGERRRYTKRFLATPAGDFREWTEREWRILARLVGHGIGPVPDVVQFDRGAGGRQALVQTYDAGVTIDHWTTLLPVRRDGGPRAHVFEDCAHWWALARHSLIALDAIHELHLVHLDLKADNVCIPVGPADFDPALPGASFFPEFERIALIDFAFSLVSGERLDSALPIARQPEYDYQSPRLLEALEEGRRGNLWPTRQLDWRCDLFSLAAMLRRYLPEPEGAGVSGWTAARQASARALVRRLLEAHDADLPATRPHGALIALVEEELRDPELAESLQRGWLLGEQANPANDDSPTPITRIALPVSSLRIATDVISLDSDDVSGWAVANPAAAPPRPRLRRGAWLVGLTAAAAAAATVPLLGEAWRAWAPPVAGSRVVAAPPVGREPVPAPRVVVAKAAPSKAEATSAATRVGTTAVASAASASSSQAPVAHAAEATVARPATQAAVRAAEPSPAATAESQVARGSEPQVVHAAPLPTTRAAEPSARRGSPVPPPRRAAAPAPAPAPATAIAAAPRPAPGTSRAVPVEVRPAAFPALAKASTRPAGRSTIYLPPAVGLAPLPSSPSTTAAAAAAPAPAPAQASARLTASSAAPLLATASPSLQPSPSLPADDAALVAPPDYMLRANELLATQIPRVAQRAERMVLRVLVAAANADEDGRDDDEVRLAAGAIRLAPDDPQLARVASREARQFHESARIALRRGDFGEALGLQTRAFGANPVDAEIVGSLAWMRLKQGPAQAEAARRLALHALTLHDWKYPSGRIEDWNTFAIASALTGHERDARNAWLVALALAGGSERQCRAAIDAYALYGEALRTPVEAMLYRANASARPQHSRLCEWPPHWAANTR